MDGFNPGLPADGVATVNRVLLKVEYSVDDLEKRGRYSPRARPKRHRTGYNRACNSPLSGFWGDPP